MRCYYCGDEATYINNHDQEDNMFKLERLSNGIYLLRKDDEFIEDALIPDELLRTLTYISEYGFGSGIPLRHTPYGGRLTDSTLLLSVNGSLI